MRVFFAIWPDVSVADRLEGLAKELRLACGGKTTRKESIHLTLVFLGEVENTDVLKDAAAGISASAFEIRMDKTAYWKHNRIAWAGTESIPERLHELVNALRLVLEKAGFGFDKRSYVPHVTLVRHAREPKTLPEFEPFSWAASEFCLVGSSDSGYQILEKWPLKIDAAFQVPG